MSKTEQREFIVGIFAALALAAVLVFTAMANRGGVQTAGDGAFTLAAAFNRADGIHVGSPVRVAGMDIGAVAAMDLDAQQRALLTMRLNETIPLPDDTAAVIETDGLFGTKYIELRSGGSEDMLKSGGRIFYTQDSVIIEDLVELVVQQAKAASAKAAAAEDASGAKP